MSPAWGEERLARLALGAMTQNDAPEARMLARDIGPVAAWRSLRAEQTPLAPIGRERANQLRAWASHIDPDALADATEQMGARFVIPGDMEWPGGLDDLNGDVGGLYSAGAPVGLWAVGPGDLGDWAGRGVAIVGARASTRYGESVAARLAGELAGQGLAVVSGGSFGIDAAAHRGALAAGGSTVIVAAGGLDAAYPPGNLDLFEAVAERGLVVSEVGPGSVATRAGFMSRARLIAGLSSGTVLVEAGARSGAASVIDWANALGRPAMAVPGPVTSAMSELPHRVIASGAAGLVTDASDVARRLQGGAHPIRLVDGHMIGAAATPAQLRHVADRAGAAAAEAVEAWRTAGAEDPGSRRDRGLASTLQLRSEAAKAVAASDRADDAWIASLPPNPNGVPRRGYIHTADFQLMSRNGEAWGGAADELRGHTSDPAPGAPPRQTVAPLLAAAPKLCPQPAAVFRRNIAI